MTNLNSNNIIVEKSYTFSLKIIELYKILIQKQEYILSKQILRSGTSIGANVQEALGSQTKKEFIRHLSVALKEAHETDYWLNLLKDSAYINLDHYQEIKNICKELLKILNSIIITTKRRYKI